MPNWRLQTATRNHREALTPHSNVCLHHVLDTWPKPTSPGAQMLTQFPQEENKAYVQTEHICQGGDRGT